MKNFKKLILIFTFSVFLFSLFVYFVIAQETEQIYPQVPGAQVPTTTKTFLPQYIKYVFNFALILAGIIAFISVVYGGVRYLASAGNPAAISDARNQITSGILGLLLLFISFLILAKLNPQLTVLKIGKVEFEKGVILYTGANCPGGADQPGGPGAEEGKDFLRVRTSMSSLGDPDKGGFNNKARSIYFYDSSEELEVKVFPQENYEGSPWKSVDVAPFNRGDCFDIPAQSKSIQLFFKIPGVYLFADSDCKTEPHLFIADNSNFTGFHDQAKSIKIVPRTETSCWLERGCAFDQCPGQPNENPACIKYETRDKLGAVLHEHSDFKGDAEVFFGGSIDTWPPSCIPLDGGRRGDPCSNAINTSYCKEAVGGESSAITIFLQRPPGSPDPRGGITLYEHENYNSDESGDQCPSSGSYSPNGPQWIPSCSLFGDDEVSSIRVEGDYIAVLFRDDGRGEVFRESDIRLKDNHIGDDQAKFILVIPVIKRGI